jgi:hypothetical protein
LPSRSGARPFTGSGSSASAASRRYWSSGGTGAVVHRRHRAVGAARSVRSPRALPDRTAPRCRHRPVSSRSPRTAGGRPRLPVAATPPVVRHGGPPGVVILAGARSRGCSVVTRRPAAPAPPHARHR